MASQLHRSGEREVERVREVAEHENADEEEHIGKARHDEGFLRRGDGGRRGVVETNEEVGRYAHQSQNIYIWKMLVASTKPSIDMVKRLK